MKLVPSTRRVSKEEPMSISSIIHQHKIQPSRKSSTYSGLNYDDDDDDNTFFITDTSDHSQNKPKSSSNGGVTSSNLRRPSKPVPANTAPRSFRPFQWNNGGGKFVPSKGDRTKSGFTSLLDDVPPSPFSSAYTPKKGESSSNNTTEDGTEKAWKSFSALDDFGGFPQFDPQP